MTQDPRGTFGQAGAPPKLLIERRGDGPVQCLRLSGAIDEQFDGAGLALSTQARWLILDLGGIERISSFGIRQWIDFVNAASSRTDGLFFVECAPKVVDQFNMVGNFGGAGYIVSFYAPYHCDTCDHDRLRLLRTDEETPLWRAGQAPGFACPTCGNAEYFDEDPATYFSYVAQQTKIQLPAEVTAFLRTQLSYGQGGQRKLKIEKRVDGRVTYVKLSGDLDSDLRAPKLADGLEGEVVFDLGHVMSLDPVGAAQWRKLLHLLEEKSGSSEQVDRIHLVAVPAVFLERLGRPQDLTHKGQVLSVLVPYYCQRCRALTQRLVDFYQHGSELRAGRVPRTQCATCNAPAACVATEAWLARLSALPAPQITESLMRTIARLQATPAARPQTGGPAMTSGTQASQIAPPSSAWPAAAVAAAPAPAGPAPLPTLPTVAQVTTAQTPAPDSRPQGPDTRPMQIIGSRLAQTMQIPGLLPGLLVVVLSLSGAIVYRILSADGPTPTRWQVIERSQPEPPAWRSAPAGPDSAAVFIGQSSFVADRQDALSQAQDAAVSEVLHRLADRLSGSNPDWRDVVVPLYEPARQELIAELRAAQKEAGPDVEGVTGAGRLAQARVRLRERQHRTSAILQDGAGSDLSGKLSGMDTYWEKLSRGDKASLVYQATVRLALGSATFERLVNLYSRTESIGQTRALPYFPMLGWRYDLRGGAVITAVEPNSPLAEAGVRRSDIVLAIQDRDVRGPGDLQRLLESVGDADREARSAAVIDRTTAIKVQRGDTLLELTIPARKHPKSPKPAAPTGRRGR